MRTLRIRAIAAAELYGNTEGHSWGKQTNGGLVTPGVFSFSNSVNKIEPWFNYSHRNMQTFGLSGILNLGWRDQLESSPWALPLLLVLMLLSCYLLIAEIPMFALKFKHWGWAENQLKYIFILCCIPILLVCGVAGISLIIVWYILVSVFKNFTDKLKQQ